MNSATWTSHWKRRDRSATWTWRDFTRRQPYGWTASCSDRAPSPTAITPTESGNFCVGKLFHNTALTDVPGHFTYELIHNGGTGRILYDLAEHYFLTGDSKWFKKNQWRMQAAAEWIIRQRTLYMKDVPNRQDLWAAGLHPPAHIADCAWGYSEWKWYTNIDAWNCQGLRRFAEAMQECDPENAARYLAEAEQYRMALQKAVDRAITLAPVMLMRNGTYRSYIPPLLYMRGPSIEQVVQISMTDQDWSLQALDAVGVPAVDDIRVDGHLDVCEDLLALNTTHIHGGNRYAFLREKRLQRGLASPEDWFWGGFAPQLGYTSLANVYLRRDEVSSFLRQWVNNYAAFVVPIPDYCFVEHFMNQANPDFLDAVNKGDHRSILSNPGYRNGHALSFFMEQYRNLLVWEDGTDLWLAKATPRHWLQQAKKDRRESRPDLLRRGRVRDHLRRGTRAYPGDGRDTLAQDAPRGVVAAAPSRGRADQVRHGQRQPVDGLRYEQGSDCLGGSGRRSDRPGELLTTITARGKSWVHSAQRKTLMSAHRKQPGCAIIEVDRESFDAFAHYGARI